MFSDEERLQLNVGEVNPSTKALVEKFLNDELQKFFPQVEEDQPNPPEAEPLSRPSQKDAEASLPPSMPRTDVSSDFVTLMERLREAVASRPDDLRGHELLARNEAALGNFRAAYEAQERVLQIKGPSATAKDFTDYADMLILAAGGYVSPEAESALSRALQLDPQNGAARYYIGLMLSQTNRPDQAFAMWQQLVMEGPADAAWMAPIQLQLKDMVLGLAERLAGEGGSPEEWARLIGALGVLGREQDAISVYNKALVNFADDPSATEVVLSGARQAGLIP